MELGIIPAIEAVILSFFDLILFYSLKIITSKNKKPPDFLPSSEYY